MQKNLKPPIILFCDIVAFSKSSSADQAKLINDLSHFTNKKLKKNCIKKPAKIPTGDGFALICFGTDVKNILTLSFELHEWACKQKQEMRIGINGGSVSEIRDINRNKNYAGYEINKTQRIMDAASGKQTLISSDLKRDKFGTENAFTFGEFQASFSEELQVLVKHYVNVSVCKVLLEDGGSIGYQGDKDPVSKDAIVITPTLLNKPIEGSFFDQLGSAEEIAFIQLNGSRLLSALNKKNILLDNQKLKRLWVCMPNPDSPIIKKGYYEKIINQNQDLDFKKIIEEWKTYLLFLKKSKSDLDVKLFMFDDIEYFGASFINWNKKNGKIHVSPYIWDTNATECPGFDLEWKANEPSDVYRRYQDGLNYLYQKSQNILDKV